MHCLLPRRCTNRVVEKGPTYRLEVFRVPSGQASSKASSSGGSSSSSSTCGGGGGTGAKGSARYTWGVRTLDFIPENAFVCEVTGQYVLGRSGKCRTTTLTFICGSWYKINRSHL